MQIALVHRTYSRRGGVERNVVALAEGLDARGHRVTILTSKVVDAPPPGAEVIGIRAGGPAAWSYSAFDRRVRKVLDRRSFDLVQGFDLTTRQDVLRVGRGLLPVSRSILRGERRRVERWTDRFSLKRALMERIERRMFLGGETGSIVAISEQLKREIVDTYGLAPESIEVFYNGVDLEGFHIRDRLSRGNSLRRELGLGNRGPLVLFVGTGFRRKGMGTLLAAFPRLRARFPRAELVVVGKDRRLGRYRKLARAQGVGDAVHFLGARSDVPRFYAMADVLAFPTHYDTFGNVTLEALASGMPVVVSACAGSSEVLTDELSEGILSNPSDEDELAGRLESLLGQLEESEHLRSLARSIAERYPLDKMVSRYEALYERLLDAPPVQAQPQLTP